MFGDNPPRGLRWANTAAARSITTFTAIIALLLSFVVLYRLQGYISCVADQQARTDARTRAISAATDAERVADTALVAGPRPGGPSADELRQASIAARNVTDLVRRQNPPTPISTC
jgi:hypothetical protein